MLTEFDIDVITVDTTDDGLLSFTITIHDEKYIDKVVVFTNIDFEMVDGKKIKIGAEIVIIDALTKAPINDDDVDPETKAELMDVLKMLVLNS